MPNGNRYVLILGRNAQEAATYARRAGLPNFTYRAVSSAASIRNIQVADVHTLPGFHLRPDKHAILRELKWGRDIRMIDVEMPPRAEAPPVDQGDGMGQQLTIDDLVATIAAPVSNVLEIPDESPRPAAESPVHVDPDEGAAAEQAKETEPKKKRRSRCGVCGRLVDGPADPRHEPTAHENQNQEDLF